jgi:hypothetical protein
MKSEPLANKSDTDRTIEAGQKRVEAGQKEEMGQRAGPEKKDGPKLSWQAADEATIEQLLRDTADPLPFSTGRVAWPKSWPPRVMSRRRPPAIATAICGPCV